MNDSGLGCRTKGHGDLHEDWHEVLGRDRLSASQVIGQGAALNQLHDDPAAAIFFARIKNVRDIRVLNAHRVSSLNAQARQRKFLPGKLGAQDLRGKGSARDTVTCLPYLTHAALRDQGEQKIPAAQYSSGKLVGRSRRL